MNINTNTPPEEKDEWRTPKFIFNWLQDRFGTFDVDLAANSYNALCAKWLGVGCYCDGERFHVLTDDSLSSLGYDWSQFGDRGYCNPPFSKPGPFYDKALEQANKRQFLTVMLTNIPLGDRYYLAAREATTIIDIIGRVSFLRPDGSVGTINRSGQRVTVFGEVNPIFRTRKVQKYQIVDLRDILNKYGTEEEIRDHGKKPRAKAALSKVRVDGSNGVAEKA